MKYLDDFNEKFGFSDGESIPPDAEAYLELYAHLVNVILEAQGSSSRVKAVDYGGIHNPLGFEIDGNRDDFYEAINVLARAEDEFDIDECIEVTVTTNEEKVKALINKLTKGV